MKLLQLLEKVNQDFKFLLNLIKSNLIWDRFIGFKNYKFNTQSNTIPLRVIHTYSD